MEIMAADGRQVLIGCHGRVAVIIFAAVLVLFCFRTSGYGTLAVYLAAAGVPIIVYAAVLMFCCFLASAYRALTVGDPAAGMAVVMKCYTKVVTGVANEI